MSELLSPMRLAFIKPKLSQHGEELLDQERHSERIGINHGRFSLLVALSFALSS